MSTRIHTILLLSSCLMGGLMTACVAPDGAPDAEAEAIDSAAQPMDAPLARPPGKRLVREWQRWAFRLPWSTGPVNDATGESCAMGQAGPVWFLAGNSGGESTRECDIPEGKEIFFPLINRFCVFPPEFYPDPRSIKADLPAIHAWYEDSRQHTCSLTLRIDGQDVFEGGFAEMVDDLYLEVDHPFEVDMNTEDNYLTQYGVAGGPMPSTGSGHYARLRPLPPGDHVLELGGSTCDGDEVWFETAVTYHLHVGE